MTPASEPPASLLSSLYSVLDDRERWTGFLQDLCGSIRATFAALSSFSLRPRPSLLQFYQWGMTEEATREYHSRWAADDPWGQTFASSPIVPGAVRRGEESCPDDLLEANSCYQGFYKPRNLHYGAAAFLVLSDHISTIFSTLQPKASGPLTHGELDLIRGLVPHLQRVLRIHDEADSLATERDLLHESFDQGSIGVVLLDQAGSILAANGRARNLLARGTQVREERGDLHAVKEGDDRALRAALQRTLDRFGKSPGGEVVCMTPDGGDDRIPALPLRLFIEPTRRGRTLTPSASSAAAIVHLIDPSAPPQLHTETLRRVLALTKSESEVVVHLANGHSVAEIAAALHVSTHTIRSHLKSLFVKTGTTQQSALVSLILRLQSPLRQTGADHLQ